MPFAPGKPISHGFDARGKTAAFAQPEAEARYEKSPHTANQPVTHRGNAPHGNRNEITYLDSVAVNEPAKTHIAKCIRALERGIDEAILFIGPAEFAVKSGLQ